MTTANIFSLVMHRCKVIEQLRALACSPFFHMQAVQIDDFGALEVAVFRLEDRDHRVHVCAVHRFVLALALLRQLTRSCCIACSPTSEANESAGERASERASVESTWSNSTTGSPAQVRAESKMAEGGKKMNGPPPT